MIIIFALLILPFLITCAQSEEDGDILDLVYILLSGEDNLNFKSYFDRNNRNWMNRELFSKGKDIQLKDLSVVGSHDSGTYNLVYGDLAPNCPEEIKILYDRLMNDTKISKYIKDAGIDVFNHLIKLYGQSISRPIFDQLEGGIRFLDFRICWTGNTPRSCHGFYAGSYDTYIGEVAGFLRESEQELVFVEFSHFYNDGTGDLYQKKIDLAKLINSTIGEFAIKRNPANPISDELKKLLDSKVSSDLLKDKPGVIIIFDDLELIEREKIDFLWPVFESGEYANSVYINTIETTQKSHLQSWVSKQGEFGRQNDGKHLFSISWTMTFPEDMNDIEFVVKNDFKDEKWMSLHGFSKIINDELIPFMNHNITLEEQLQINIIWIDYFYESLVIDLVKNWDTQKLKLY